MNKVIIPTIKSTKKKMFGSPASIDLVAAGLTKKRKKETYNLVLDLLFFLFASNIHRCRVL